MLSINNQDFIPEKSLKPIEFNGARYYPVKLAPESIVDELKPITPNKKGTIITLKLQNTTYIPFDVIPKKFTKIFKPIIKKLNIVLLVKGNYYVPIQGRNVLHIKIKGIEYMPVKIASKR